MMKLHEYSWRHAALLPPTAAWFLFCHPYMEPTGVLVTGAVLFVSGEALRVWATGHLRKNEVLTIGGPYRYVRNPMYLGTLLIVTGLCLAGGDHVILAAFLAIFCLNYIPRKERREGQRLLKKFGMGYAQYVVSVGSLVPRLKPYETPGAVRFSFRQALANNEHQTALSLLIAVAGLVVKLVYAHPWVHLPPWLAEHF
jgi:protein-S-isoprenylcysteine O-methyltransferase Ste14